MNADQDRPAQDGPPSPDGVAPPEGTAAQDGRSSQDGPEAAPYLPPKPLDDPETQTPPRRRWWLIVGAVVLLLAIAGLVLWPLLTGPADSGAGDAGTPEPSVSRAEDPGLDGIIARDVPPAQFRPGDCLTDFETVNEPATVIECGREHEAQVVGRKLWPTTRDFPGESMAGQAEDFCGTIQLGPTGDAEVIVEISHPTEGTWAAGDRRVDCLAVAHDGVLTRPLVQQPVFEDWTEHD